MPGERRAAGRSGTPLRPGGEPVRGRPSGRGLSRSRSEPAENWSLDKHALMQSVPGYNAAELDSNWRVHLVAVPARLGCSRGVMFDSSLGADPNAVPREGTATFSHDGYPASEVPDGTGGSHYDTAADQQQRNVPRAYLRSATHEVGHAFNQIHQGFEGGNDNSIMTPTPSVATVLGTGGTFPDGINLAFNDRVRRHLRHYPDPAVRPGRPHRRHGLREGGTSREVADTRQWDRPARLGRPGPGPPRLAAVTGGV